MAIERELRLLLEYARVPIEEANATTGVKSSQVVSAGDNQEEEEEADQPTGLPSGRVAAKEIYKRLLCVRHQRVLPSTSIAADLNIPELLVLVAEAAVYQQDFEVAGSCVEWFLSDCNLKNQFYCRMQLVRAHCASNDAVSDTGAVKLRKVLNAIHFILLVLPIAMDVKRRPQYDFLVYNASVTYWQIARQLMKTATFQYLVPSLTSIVDSLKAVGEKDVLWQLRLRLSLVYAQIDARQYAACAKMITEIVEAQLTPLLSDTAFSGDAAFVSLYEEALRLQVHIASFKDPECQKMLSNLATTTTSKKGTSGTKRTSLLTKLQALKSGAFAGTLEAALTEIFQETTAMSSFAMATSTDDEITAHFHALDAASLHAVDAEILVETGILAAFQLEYRVAACCDVVLRAKGKNMDAKFRVLHQVLRAILLALVPPTSTQNGMLSRAQRAALVVARRAEGVKAMERALLACKRQQDATLMESVCLYAWNLSLPLLQPGSRTQLSRLFTQASVSLEELQSLQLNLRVRLLLEVAKLEAQSQCIAKAQAATNKAIALDYATLGGEVASTAAPTLDELTVNESKWLLRPLDVHLVPLKKRLDLKLTCGDPSSTDEELTSAVEQLQEAKDDAQRRRHVDRVLAVVRELRRQRETGSADGLSPSSALELLLHLNTTSAIVWHQLKDVNVARELTQEALALFFPSGGDNNSSSSSSNNNRSDSSVFRDKSVMLLEVDLRLRLVEMIGSELKQRAQRFEQVVAQHDATMAKHGKKPTSRHTASRPQTRKLQPEDQVDAAAMLLLSKESHALGLSLAAAVATTATATADPAAATEDLLIQQRHVEMETEVLTLKKALLQELLLALQASTRIGWSFVVENTAVYVWNYHFHVFRLLLSTEATAATASSILPECISAFESTLAALEAMPQTSVNVDLLASIAFGLALTHEKLGKVDKATAIADSILKRLKSSSTALQTSSPPSSVSVLFLKRFTELKIRVQIRQNVKEIQLVEISPPLKVVSLLEAMQVTLHQIQIATPTATATATTATAPTQAAAAQLTEKASGFFQKAITAWQLVASDVLQQVKSDALTLEEQQQQLELYCEIWVRLGCGAFHFQNAKLAITCSERALDPITTGMLTPNEQKVWIVEATYKWLAIAELLYARSILTLLSGETAAWTLIEAALHHVVGATRFALRAHTSASAVVRKASEVAWNTVLTAMAAVETERAMGESSDANGGDSEAQWWTRLLPLLQEVLTALSYIPGASQFRGDFGLLLLDVCEKAKTWAVAIEIAESLMMNKASSTGAVPAEQLKEITTFHAIAQATMGSGNTSSSSSGSGGGSGGGGRGADHDPLMQAKIMRRIAFSSWRHPPAQLKALATALKELDGRPEEQALVLVDMAEWFYTHQFPLSEMEAHLEPAVACLVRAQQQQAQQQHQQRLAESAPMEKLPRGADTDHERGYSSLWFAEKLIRVFTMRAIAATTMPQRWENVQHALHQVHLAWQSIMDAANDHDLRERFTAESTADKSLEFDAWKRDKATKFQAHAPRTTTTWVTLYQQYATSSSSRFFMQWLPALRDPSVQLQMQLLSNPILLCSVLEKLLRFLASYHALELALPVVCLYQVVYHAFCPHKSKAMEIWMELTLYDVLEKMNLPTWNVPLQSALEFLQSGGDTILKELQQQEQDEPRTRADGTAITSRRRGVLKLSQINVAEKAAQNVELLLTMGYVRQAKVLLAMLQNLADRKSSGDQVAMNQCIALTAQVHELEGAHDKARVSLQQLLVETRSPVELALFVNHVLLYSKLMISDPHKAIEILVAAERDTASAIMAVSDCVLLHQPMHAQAVAKYVASLSSTSTSRQSSGSTPSMAVDLDAITLLAQLKCQHACLLLESASATVATVEHAQRVFRDASELLAFVESKAARAQLTVAFATRLVERALRSDGHLHMHARQRDLWLVEARGLLQEALVWLETLRSRTFEPLQQSLSTSATIIAIPLDVEIAALRIQLATLDIQLEESGAIVAELQMTWYAYERDTKRNIVEKWLDQTAQRPPVERMGSVTKAFALASSASVLLVNGPEPLQARGLAQAIRLQCQRLALYHHGDVDKRLAVHRSLWTLFTTESSPHETWVCAANEGVSASDERRRSTPSLSPSPSGESVAAPSVAALVAEPVDVELQEQLASLAALLESELQLAMDKRHIDVMRICARELVHVYGCSQPEQCVRALLLYQSVVVRELCMEPLVEKCLVSSNVTKLHKKRIERLVEHHTNAYRNSLPFQLSQLFLDQQSDIHKRMNVCVPMETILAALPSTMRVLSLQLSPDRCFLYAALTGSSSDKGIAVARMECTTDKLRMLTDLQSRVRAWRQSVAKCLLSGDDTTTSQPPASDVSDFSVISTTESAPPEDTMETEFNAIVTEMLAFFHPLFDHSAFSAALQSELVADNTLVLIVDRAMEFLPLEALPAFAQVDAISREFSIHLLYQRLVQVKAQPFKRDDVRVIVDPRREDTGLSDQTLTSVVHQYTKKPGAPFANWKDAVDHGQVPTRTDWQQAMLLRRGGTLWYMGPNRAIGSAITLPTLAGMNVSSACYALLLLDRAESQSSARRQSKIDSDKLRWEIELEEDPYACALLCSLCGVNVVVLNQWTGTFHSTRRLASGLLSGLAKGQSIAKAVRRYPETASPVVVSAPVSSSTRKASTIGLVATATASPSSATDKPQLKNRIRYSTAVFGLGHLAFKE